MRYLLVMFVTAVCLGFFNAFRIYHIQFPKAQKFTNQVRLVNFAV